ncbi:MAG TPA: hypothetical protein VFP31_05115 [Gaiellaceae bacterium]|nr:hypothetical protein [Gaiellaceae bacterium]
MADEADFSVRHEAADELKRLASHPVDEVTRLEHEALEGKTPASLLIIVVGVFAGVSVIVTLVYGLVELVTWLAT